MTDPLRESYLRVAASIRRAYPDSNRDLVNSDGYARNPDPPYNMIFLRPFSDWTSEDFRRGRIPQDILRDLYDMAADGYYDILCQRLLPRHYGAGGEMVIQYIEDISAAYGRQPPASFAELRRIIRAGGSPAVDISAIAPTAEPTAAAAATETPAADTAAVDTQATLQPQNFDASRLPALNAVYRTDDANAPALTPALEAALRAAATTSARITGRVFMNA